MEDKLHVFLGVESPEWMGMDKALSRNPELGERDEFWERYKQKTDRAMQEAEVAYRTYDLRPSP